VKLTGKGWFATKDKAECEVDDDIFDSYDNPKVSPALWERIFLHDERIMGAKEISLVWYRFGRWISKHLPPDAISVSTGQQRSRNQLWSMHAKHEVTTANKCMSKRMDLRRGANYCRMH
jgi:hypothetical protein